VCAPALYYPQLLLTFAPTTFETHSYTDENNQQKARIDFCIRFSLYTDDISSSNAQEVNFQETLVTFFADLTDGFQLGDVVVENKDRLERNARIECEIIAYECDRQNNRLEGPRYVRNQGREVRVCVELSEESKKEGLLLDRIHWFYWILENEFQTVRQNAIVFDSVQSPDTLTEYECLRGAELCPFNTLLYAKFYQWANGELFALMLFVPWILLSLRTIYHSLR
jgi:hypothetical protein